MKTYYSPLHLRTVEHSGSAEVVVSKKVQSSVHASVRFHPLFDRLCKPLARGTAVESELVAPARYELVN